MITRLRPAMLALLLLVTCLKGVVASADKTRWITWQDDNGETIYLKDNRRPSLYTNNFGDCLGDSLVNVTRFDAAYYADNMTVTFHLEGSSALQNESLVMYIGVYAYGESRFDLVFNPCHANIDSLCPLNSSVPIEASGIIPVGVQDTENIPPLALNVPDFEGQAILRIFANSTEQEIGCYSGVITNGHSFSQPKSVGTVLGIFALITVIASFATAIYGEAIPTMRLHYAHSLSAGVVFAVYQHIFFSGALSVNWPSVLVAWWSNFAWSGGMIHNTMMQNSINRLIGNDIGNTSQVGAAPSDSTQNVGGGYDISQIYGRSLASANHPVRRDLVSEIYKRTGSMLDGRNLMEREVVQRHVERALQTRDFIANKSDGYKWYGHPVGPGLPLPGNYSGFAGTLAEEGIRVSNAFMTGFLWFLILLALVVGAVMIFKWLLEGLVRFKAIKADRLKFFRDHWIRYTAVVALRTCFIAFFMIMFLTIFEFTYQSAVAVKVVAAVVFFIFIIGIFGVSAYACYYKKHFATSNTNSAGNHVEHKKLLGFIPWVDKKQPGANAGEVPAARQSKDNKRNSKSFWRRSNSVDGISREQDVGNIHDNDDYTMKFGWLTSRFRRTRWWFFTVWLCYEFLRAVFYAGASGYALVQVFGLLIIEFLAFVYIIWARPFEGRRLNIIVVYCLGFSKVASVALSAAFDIHFNLARITTTVIGIVIIVIQGVLTIITMIAVIVGAISSYMSMSRNHEEFRPRKWHGLREKYFNHLDRVVNDIPREPKPKPLSPAAQAELDASNAGFEMKGVRRLAKIEDDDAEFASEVRSQDPNASYQSISKRASTPINASDTALAGYRSGTMSPARRSRAGSMQSLSQSNLPYGARPHRASWSNRDFSSAAFDDREQTIIPVNMSATVPEDDPDAIVAAAESAPKKTRHRRSASLSSMLSKQAAVPPQVSTDSLHIGGDVSTRDTIGNVPTPAMRPRSGTHGSNRNSRSGTPVGFGDLEMPEYQPRSNRASYPLTPALEKDEWGTPKQSHDEEI